MKKRSTKLGTLLLSLSMLCSCWGVQALAAEADVPDSSNKELTYMSVPVSAQQGTSANLTTIVEYDGSGTLPTIGNGGTVAAVENLPDKAAYDKGIRMEIQEGGTNAYANLSVFDSQETTVAISARTVTFDVYPNNTVTSIQLKGRATKHPNYEIALSDDIPMEALKAEQWNKVMYLYNPDGTNSIYINNAFYASNNTHFTAPSTSSKLTYADIRLYAKTAATEGAYIDLDNIQTAKGAAVMPAVISGKYIIDSQIHEYGKNATVADVLSNIVYNGTSYALKNSSGEDITEDAEAKVSKDDILYVYDGSVETGRYSFGYEHKPLTALKDNSDAVMANGFDDDVLGFIGNNASVEVKAGTEYGKPASDKVLNVLCTDTSTVYYIQRTTKAEDRTKVSTISFEVYPNGTWGRFDISTNGGAYFLRVPAARLKTNEWNQITLVIGGEDKTIRPSAVYINGKQVTGETNSAADAEKIYINESLLMGNTAASGQVLRIGASIPNEGGSNLLIDNFYQAEGQALVPALTSQAYLVDGEAISEYMQAAVKDVISDIAYNGSSAVITNTDGDDITSNLNEKIANGYHLYIYDGDFITGHYVFKSSHEAPTVIKSYIDNFDEISVANGTYTTESGVNGKGESNTTMKLTADTSTASATTNTGTVYIEESVFNATTKSVPASSVTFEVYPNNSIDEIVIAGRANSPNYEISFQKIPVSDLAAKQWNRILFEYNVTGENKVYINGNLYASADSGHFNDVLTYGNIRIKANYTKKDGVTPYVYIDEIQAAYGRVLNPAIETETYGIDGNMISGCTDTAANVKANITTALGASLVIKNSEGVEIADAETVALGNSIYVYDGDMIIAHYYAEAGKMIMQTPVIVNSGIDAGDTVTANITYSETDGIVKQFDIYIAAYNKTGELIGVSVKPITTSGSGIRKTISAEPLTLTESAQAVKAIVMDDNLNPLCRYGSVERVPVVCWGDSLTYGAGATSPSVNSYPSQLAKIIGESVINMGVPGETAMTVAARQGAYDIVLTEGVTIPASGAVTFSGLTSTGGAIAPCSAVSGGWNPCTLGGIEGNITADISTASPPKALNSVTFTRSKDGEECTLPAGTKLITSSQKISAEWNVIFVGTNGGWSSDNLTASDHLAGGDADKLVKLIGDMINHTGNSEKCIVIGLTVGGTKYESVNSALSEAFGKNFINAKAYLATEKALSDAGISPTEDDTASIAEREVPPSLLSDAIHFNDAGYKLLAQHVYNKLTELGFEN